MGVTESAQPFQSYRGNDDFIFASYAHADSESVYPDLACLKDAGFNVWYDEGISPGSRWTTELADAIERCSVFVAFLSPNAVASENCTNEIEFAVAHHTPILVVHLQDTTLPPGLELSLGGRQAILKTDLGSDEFKKRLEEGVHTLASGSDPFKGKGTGASGFRRGWLAFAVVVALIALLIANQFTDTPVESDLRVAIAVRQFETSTTDPSRRFFADGIADDLVLRLGQWRSLPVIARGSSFAANLPRDPIAAGKALNARYLVEGTVHSNGGQLKLNVFLVDAADARNVWSQEFERPWSDALELQYEIADAIVAEINPALLSAETQRAVRADPTNLDAWTAAMRGWWHLNTETKEGLAEAEIWFGKAAELDPVWSWPHSAIGLAAYRAIINGWSSDMRASYGVLIESAEKAVQLDPLDAFAHHALGHAYAARGRLEESLNALQRGVELSPNDPMANGCYAMQLAASNRPGESFPVVAHAMSISPNDPWQHRFALVRARAHFSASEYAESEKWALRSLQLRPTTGAFLHSVAAPALGQGLDRATERADEARQRKPLPPLAGIERGFKRQTHPEYVARLIEGLRRAGFE